MLNSHGDRTWTGDVQMCKSPAAAEPAVQEVLGPVQQPQMVALDTVHAACYEQKGISQDATRYENRRSTHKVQGEKEV
jgi:hypothetical protein